MTKTYDWTAEAARAEAAHHRVERFADGLLDAATSDLHPWERELLHERYRAAMQEAWAFATYAEHAASVAGLPNTIEVPGRTLAEDVALRGGAA